MRQYARQIKNVEMEAWVAEIRVRAERRDGKLLKKQDKAKGGRPSKKLLPASGAVLEPPTLADRAVDVARRRLRNDPSVSKPQFPPEAAHYAGKPEAQPDLPGARANSRSATNRDC